MLNKCYPFKKHSLLRRLCEIKYIVGVFIDFLPARLLHGLAVHPHSDQCYGVAWTYFPYTITMNFPAFHLTLVVHSFVFLFAGSATTSLCPISDGLEWLPGVNMHHELLMDSEAVICGKNDSCEDFDSIGNFAQLKPVTISVHDVIVPVLRSPQTTLNTSILLQQVNDFDAFASCNYSSVNTFRLENITNIRINTSGQFYFIVIEPIEWCAIGLRFAVNVKDEDCRNGNSEELCYNEGNCVANPGDDTYACVCCDPYIGRYCQEKDGCNSNPCQNSGLCVDITEGLSGSTFQCLCPFGFRGALCEEAFDPCDSSPCLNNGTCITKGSSYECICPENYSGTSCQIEPDLCSSKPCIHGICKSVHQSYQCYCYPGFGGGNCEFEYDECDSNPCMNGGLCEDGIAGFSCHCPPGFIGNHCQIHGDLCDSNPCAANQICVSRDDHYTCSCPDGFTGENCETNYDPCEPSPCFNGGRCWEKYGSIFCVCKPGFSGKNCEVIKKIEEIDSELVEELVEYERGGNELDGGILTRGGNELDGGILTSNQVKNVDLHNIYIASGTLLAAIVLVLSVVVVCHCAYRRPYNRFANTSNLPRISSSTSLFQKGKLKKILSSKNSTIDSIYDRKSREYCIETLDIPLISSIKNDERI